MAVMVSDRLAATMGFAGGPDKARAVRTNPVRLTRRGRMMAAGASALLIGALSLTLATAAQAAHDGAAPTAQTPGKYLTKVTVRSGDSLYSLAEAYDPNADPRAVVQRVIQMNSLPGYQVQPGEVLWMPRD